jgi:hypothetical protein
MIKNPVAKDLRTPKYRTRTVSDRKNYNRCECGKRNREDCNYLCGYFDNEDFMYNE